VLEPSAADRAFVALASGLAASGASGGTATVSLGARRAMGESGALADDAGLAERIARESDDDIAF
jgi:hypothetical protein